MEVIDEQTRLDLSNGPAEINYIFSVPTIPETDPPEETSEFTIDYSVFAIIGGLVSAGVVGALILVKKRKSPNLSSSANTEIIVKKQPAKTLDTDTIFKLRPDMRDDDKEIVRFISENGGQVLESELRKKFLQPRTTMWRAVKRLERLDIVEITKKDLQNMVKLKEELEEEK